MGDFNINQSAPFSFKDDELKEDFSRVSVKIGLTTSLGSDEVTTLDTRRNQEECEFVSNLAGWQRDSSFMSVNNFESSYFDAIVEMKEDAVPFIFRELQKGPTPLVHALDRIYEGEMEYMGYLPLDFVCKVWLEILKKKGINV
jgi:hypothetical protein